MKDQRIDDLPLFELAGPVEELWQGMPEIIEHEDKNSIIVQFETTQDIAEFSRLIGQRVNIHTDFISYPERML